MPKLFSGFELITVTDNYEDMSSFREFKIYVNAASATITLPIDLPVGSLRIVKKIHPTQGTVTIESAGAEKFTRAELDDVTLNADGDYWLLEKVSANRWDLLEGYETGENANGKYWRNSSSHQICTYMWVIGRQDADLRLTFEWEYPVTFSSSPIVQTSSRNNSTVVVRLRETYVGLSEPTDGATSSFIELVTSTADGSFYAARLSANGNWY